MIHEKYSVLTQDRNVGRGYGKWIDEQQYTLIVKGKHARTGGKSDEKNERNGCGTCTLPVAFRLRRWEQLA